MLGLATLLCVFIFKPIRLIAWYTIIDQKHFPQVKGRKWKKQQILIIGSIFILVVLTTLSGLFISLGWDSDQIEIEIDNKTLAFFRKSIGNQYMLFYNS